MRKCTGFVTTFRCVISIHNDIMKNAHHIAIVGTNALILARFAVLKYTSNKKSAISCHVRDFFSTKSYIAITDMRQPLRHLKSGETCYRPFNLEKSAVATKAMGEPRANNRS